MPVSVTPDPVAGVINMDTDTKLGFVDEDSEMVNIELSAKVQEFCKTVCSKETLKNKIPSIRWIPKYSFQNLQCDLIAGLTVGLTVIPQGLAYAKLAGLPAQYGLYSSFMGCFVYCLLGTSKDITLGPTAIMSLMTGAFATSPIKNDGTYAVVLCLMCGVVQFVMGILNLGILVNFISYPVINSFTSAAAITIAAGQVKSLLGLHNIPRQFGPMIYATFKNIAKTNLWDLLLGVCCLILLYFIKKFRTIKWGDEEEDSTSTIQKVSRKLLWLVGTGANAIIVISAAGIAAALLSQNITGKLTITGHLKEGLPPFEPPSFSVSNRTHTYTASDIFSSIGAGFGIVPLIGLVETIAIGKAFARQNNYRIDPSQELVAIGMANILSSFVSSYPVTGSFSRTAVNSQSGVKTPANGIFTGALILLALDLLTPLFYYIPNAALAAVIISAVLQMVDYKIVVILWKANKLDLVPYTITFVASLAIGIEYGILVGIGISILMLLYPTARPALKENAYKSPKEDVYSIDLKPLQSLSRPGILVVRANQGLMFPAAEYFHESIVEKALGGGRKRSVILDFQHISGIDYSTVQSLMQLMAEMKRQGRGVILACVSPPVMYSLQKANIPGLVMSTSVEEACEELNVQEDSELEVDENQPLIRKTR